MTKYKLGDKIEIIQDVEKFPHFTVKKGMTGKIIQKEHGLLIIKIDQYIKNCEYWENTLELYSGEYLEIADKYIKIIK